MSKKVLFIVGSLRQGSFNHQMALEAEKALAGKAEVSYLDYSALPLFSPRFGSSNTSSCSGCSRSGSRCGCHLDLLSSLQLLYPWNSEKLA